MGHRSPSSRGPRMTLALGATPPQLTRRRLLRTTLSAGALGMLGRRTLRAAPPDTEISSPRWRPWLLTRGDELRPVAPSAPSPEEFTELMSLQSTRTATVAADVARWDAPSVVLPWTNLALDLILIHQPNPVRAARALALLHVAAVRCARRPWDARGAPAPSPTASTRRWSLFGSAPASSLSFPSRACGRGGSRRAGARVSIR